MEYKKEDMLDLCEESVKYLFNYCVATNETADDNIRIANFIDEHSEQKVPDMKFDKKRAFEKANSINYLLGQFKSLHIGNKHMFLEDGFCKYDDTIWTRNKMILFTLYYLGDAVNRFPLFMPSSIGLLAYLGNHPGLQPTLSPNDPNFKG